MRIGRRNRLPYPGCKLLNWLGGAGVSAYDAEIQNKCQPKVIPLFSGLRVSDIDALELAEVKWSVKRMPLCAQY
jgi:hypothetical protein